MTKIWFVLCALMLSVVSSCADRKVDSYLQSVESSLSISPDSALVLLTSMSEPDNARQKARYALLRAKTLYKCFIDTSDLSIISPAVEYYLRHGTKKNKMETLYYLGCIQQNGGNYTDAVSSLSEAGKFADDCGDFFTKGLISATLSILNNNLHDYSEQLHFAELAFKAFSEAGNKDYRQYAMILQGVAFHNQRRYDEAEAAYQEVISHDPDDVNLQDARAHLALTLASRWEPDIQRADSLFNLVICETGKLPTQNMWGAYAYVNDILDRMDVADEIYCQLDSTDRVKYGWYARSLYSRGRYKQAYDNLSSSILYQAEMLNVALTQTVQKEQRSRAEERERNAIMMSRQQRVAFFLAILSLLLLSAILYVWWNRRYERILDENGRLVDMAKLVNARMKELERESVKNDSDSLQDAYIRLYQSQFRRIGILHDTLLYAERHGMATQPLLTEVRKMVEDIQKDRGGNKPFEDVINKKLNGLMARFRTDFPGRPESDYRLMSYIIAGFDATTIATLLNLPSNPAAHMRKARLNKLVCKADEAKQNSYLRYF